MPRSPGDIVLLRKWIMSARADLAIAKVALPEGGMYEQLCFHAQQAVEKAVKALLLYLGTDFPLTHNIQWLLDLLPASIQSEPALADAPTLTPYAVLTRYPSTMEAVTAEKHAEAVRIASDVLEWVEARIGIRNWNT